MLGENYSEEEEENEDDIQMLTRNVFVNPKNRLSQLGINYLKASNMIHATAFSAVDEE